MRNRLVALKLNAKVLLADNETLQGEKLAAGDDSSKTWFALSSHVNGRRLVGLLMPRVRRARVDTNL